MQTQMIDVGGKEITRRDATATGAIRMKTATAQMVQSATLPKGNALETARVAAIMAAKKYAADPFRSAIRCCFLASIAIFIATSKTESSQQRQRCVAADKPASKWKLSPRFPLHFSLFTT